MALVVRLVAEAVLGQVTQTITEVDAAVARLGPGAVGDQEADIDGRAVLAERLAVPALLDQGRDLGRAVSILRKERTSRPICRIFPPAVTRFGKPRPGSATWLSAMFSGLASHAPLLAGTPVRPAQGTTGLVIEAFGGNQHARPRRARACLGAPGHGAGEQTDERHENRCTADHAFLPLLAPIEAACHGGRPSRFRYPFYGRAV